MPRDAPSTTVDVGSWEKDIEYRCVRCGAVITRGRWEMSFAGGHQHTFTNPAGLAFLLACFKEAPGAEALGSATGNFTWFRGYLWRLVACRACDAHLGWRYEGSTEPRVFFGLIRDGLTTRQR